jgi:hypothetical protein
MLAPMSLTLRHAAFIALGLALSATAARADKIDGNWCSPTNATMTIEGPRVVTPGGKVTQGDYYRHHFDYIVPEGDEDAGAHVHADLIDEDHIILTLTAPNATGTGKPEVWKRCQVVS